MVLDEFTNLSDDWQIADGLDEFDRLLMVWMISARDD